MTEDQYLSIKQSASDKYLHGKRSNLPLNARVMSPLFVFYVAACCLGLVSFVASVCLIPSADTEGSKTLLLIVVLSAVMFLSTLNGASDLYWNRQACTSHQVEDLATWVDQFAEVRNYILRLDAMGIVPRRYEYHRMRRFVEAVSKHHKAVDLQHRMASIISNTKSNQEISDDFD